jgi:hypothetical protein
VVTISRPSATLFVSSEAAAAILRLTFALMAVIAISSLGGVFLERTLYWRDLPYWTTQVFTQDLANLVVVLPLLGLSAVGVRRGSPAAFVVWLGLILFLVYVYACYGFALRFNRMFLVHCLAFGLCVYALTVALRSVDADYVRRRFSGRHTRAAAWFLVGTGFAMCLFWLAVAIPAVAADTLPDYAIENGYVTSPIHMLDLGIFFPGLIVAGLLLRSGRPYGFVAGPALLVFSVVMTSCLIEQAVALQARGLGSGLEYTIVFGVVFVGSLLALAGSLGRSTEPETPVT